MPRDDEGLTPAALGPALLAMLRAAAGERGAALAAIPELAPRLASARAAAAPGPAQLDGTDAAWMAEVVARLSSPPPAALFSPEVLGELRVVAACRLGDPDALRTFDAILRGVATPLFRKYQFDSARADEVLQQLRIRLLISPAGSGSRLDQYAGTGSLRAWLRAACARTILNVLRDEGVADRREAGLQRVLDDVGGGAPLDANLGAELGALFAASIAALARRDRLLLKQHYVDGLSTRELGALHAVHGVTAMRWLAAAQDRLIDDLRARVQAHYGVATAERESLLRELRGTHLDVTLRRLLASG